jgi:hypothetical protein
VLRNIQLVRLILCTRNASKLPTKVWTPRGYSRAVVSPEDSTRKRIANRNTGGVFPKIVVFNLRARYR